jgi:hypothetical protein
MSNIRGLPLADFIIAKMEIGETAVYRDIMKRHTVNGAVGK